MSEILKCPECQGAKCVEVAYGKYRCQYCGATFEVEKPQGAPAPSQQPPAAPQVVYVQQVPQQPYPQNGPVRVADRSKLVAALLAFFLGGFGGQFFYLGQTSKGILCILFCWTYIPCIIGFIDLIRFLCMSDREFDMKYNMRYYGR